MSGRYATEQDFFNDRQRLVCGCIGRCAGHNDADDPLGIKAAQRIATGHHKLTIEALKKQHDAASDHGVRGMIDGKMWDMLATFIADNPRKLPVRIVSVLVSADRCAKCLGELDTGWECNDCGYDWKPWMDASSAIHNELHNRREG
jgi:hypothetical protein